MVCFISEEICDVFYFTTAPLPEVCAKHFLRGVHHWDQGGGDERDQSSKHATLDSEHFRLARVRRSFSPGICSSIKRDVVVEVVDVALVVGGL